MKMISARCPVSNTATRIGSRRVVRGNTTVDSADFVEIGVDGSGSISQVVGINHSGEDEVIRELIKGRLSGDEPDGLLPDPCRKLGELLV
ncbi:MAG: hypothetical protein NTU53_20275 [Planctomycetota bacterium]|nr:hypothetical protein [Planctomycetota bacterium]